MRVQVIRGFPYAFAYIFRFRGAQNHTVPNAKLRELSRQVYDDYNTNSPRSHRQLYDCYAFSRPPKYMYLCHPLPAGPPPASGAAGQHLCPCPFPQLLPSRREALPRLPARCDGPLRVLHYNGHGTFKNPIFATRCPLGHPLPLEPLVSISASAPSPSPPENALLLRRSRS